MPSIKYVVINGWLCETSDRCTCGTGGSASGYPGHEHGCGVTNIIKVEDLLVERAVILEKGRHQIRDQVVALWNHLDGWIPGGAYEQLAEALLVDAEVLLEVRRNRRPPVEAPGSY